MNSPLWPILAYFVAVLLVTGSMIGFSWLLGQRHQELATGQPFESGMKPVTSARLRFAARFYLVAMFFLIFDLETVFLFGWAVAAREAGWPGFIEAAIFVGILVAALIYLWRVGALDQGRESPFSGKAGPERPRQGSLQLATDTGQPRAH